MDLTSFNRQMANFSQWKESLSVQLSQCLQWLEEHQYQSQPAMHCLKQASALLKNDSFTVACVGEFSRGKTELINALLFTEYGGRILPSRPGRTTMCPTEIFFDPADKPGCVRLLPIETRRTSTSMNNFKRIPKNWVTVEFDVKDPASIARAMSEISKVKQVSGSEARAMGFDPQQLNSGPQGELEVPVWRHALVNLNHPLLRNGLRILDTPGLNALGNEPELTLSTLHQADALVFLLAADAGLSYTDIAIWQDHLQDLRGSDHSHGRTLAVLNKVDTLWDDLTSAQDVEFNIHTVREATARLLSQPIEHVIAVSAKQGLIAKATHNSRLLQRSKLPELESLLAQQLIHNQQRLMDQRIIKDAINIMHSTRHQLKEQLYQSDLELERLQKLAHNPEKFQSLVGALRSNIRQRHQRYHRQSLDLRSYQRVVDKSLDQLQGPLAPIQVEGLISTTHQQMIKSWSFIGLAKAMDEFFIELRLRFERIEADAKLANSALMEIYERASHHECGEQAASEHCFHVADYRRRLEQLERQAQQFRRSLGNIFSLKQRVIGRFINSLVQEVRTLNTQLQTELSNWAKEALAPMSHQTQYQKQLLDKQMLQMTNLNQQKGDREQRLTELRSLIAQLGSALFELDQILAQVNAGMSTSRSPTLEHSAADSLRSAI